MNAGLDFIYSALERPMQSRIRKWSGVDGHFSLQVDPADFSELLPDVMRVVDLGETVTLEVDFESRGYYDPGRTYGDPYNCYPPEGEDERTLVDLWFEVNGKRVRVPRSLEQKIFDHFLERISEVQLRDE